MAENRVQGFVNLISCVLIPSIGEPIQIGKLASEINIYQDLNYPYMTCDIVISDSVGLFATMDRGAARQGGFTGQEILVLQYATGDKNERSHAFLLHKVLTRGDVKEKKEVIVISGISIEKHFTYDKKISRAYGGEKGNSVDKIVKSIVDEFIYNKTAKAVYGKIAGVTNVSIKKFNHFDETRSKLRIVLPSVEPMEAIKMLTGEADNDTGAPHFIFYEDHDGYQFADVSKLVTDEPQFSFEYAPAGYHEVNYNIIEYDVLKQNDLFDALEKGLAKSRTINLDILKKQKREVVYDYSKSGPKFSKLNNSFLVPGYSEEQAPDAVIHLVTSRTGHDTEGSGFSVKDLHGYDQGGENFLPLHKNVHTAARASYRKHLSNFMLRVVVPGNSGINVGRTCILNIPQPTINDTGATDTKPDKYLSGIYLITEVRDQIQKGREMFTTMTMIKDSESMVTKSAPEEDWKRPR